MAKVVHSPTGASQRAVKVHPACDLFPMMDEAKLKELADDIKKNDGLLFPIVLDEEGLLVDGRNRLKACDLAGVEPSFTTMPDGFDPFDYVLAANIYRRHLTPKQRRELIKKLLKARPTKSNRTIGRQTEASDKTVASIRREMERRAEIPRVTIIEDSRGRLQPLSVRVKLIGSKRRQQPIRAAVTLEEPSPRQVLATMSLDEHGEAIMALNASQPGYALQLVTWINARLDGERSAGPLPRTH